MKSRPEEIDDSVSEIQQEPTPGIRGSESILGSWEMVFGIS